MGRPDDTILHQQEVEEVIDRRIDKDACWVPIVASSNGVAAPAIGKYINLQLMTSGVSPTYTGQFVAEFCPRIFNVDELKISMMNYVSGGSVDPSGSAVKTSLYEVVPTIAASAAGIVWTLGDEVPGSAASYNPNVPRGVPVIHESAAFEPPDADWVALILEVSGANFPASTTLRSRATLLGR